MRFSNFAQTVEWVISLLIVWYIRSDNRSFFHGFEGVKKFNEHILENFSSLLTDNLQYWVDYFPDFAACISDKLAEKGNIHYPANSFRLFGFHDDTVIGTCRPGGGPTNDGGRHCNFIQMSFYNGWKKHHGIKFQSLELPNGMCGHIYGPKSFRHSDLE